MTVRPLKAAQRGPWCSYCEGEKVRATHRGLGFTKFSCAAHVSDLEAADMTQTRMDRYETEGERQAMGRFWA
jgi:hypothetical protein